MKSSLFIFIGAKGGVGTSTLCYELANALAQKAPSALVDADFSGRRSIGVLSGLTKAFDTARADSEVAVAKNGSLTAVELTDSYDMAMSINVGRIAAAAEQLSEGYSAVYVDAPQPFAASVRSFIARGTRFLLVLRPDLMGMTGARAMLSGLIRFGVPKERIIAVMDWHYGKAEMTKREVQDMLGLEIAGEIPPSSDRNFHKAIEALNAYLLLVPDAGPIASLEPSIAAPLGERRRRAGERGSGPANFNGSPTANGSNGSQSADSNGRRHAVRAEDEARNQIKMQIHQELGKRLDFVAASHAHSDADKLTELRKKIEELTRDILRERTDVGGPEEVSMLRREVIDEALGLGPLEDLLHDESISEIMVNGPDQIYVERSGKLERTNKRFSDGSQLRVVIDRIIAPIGRRVDEASPMVDARLSDGSRVNAIIEPLALDGASVTIRRFGKKRLNQDDLIRVGALNEPMVAFLGACIKARLNILVSGGTGSGKTTLLNILSNFIPEDERIVTIEDAAELLLGQPHVVRLESRPSNIEGHGEVRIRDLVKNSLRMRPDRIVVGECRGAEALDMLQAMNTGHDGSLTTVHANSPRDAVSRIETLVMMAGFDLPVRAIREQIAGALDLVIQAARLRDGSRKIISISEVVGMEGDVVTMQEIVRYDQQGINEDNKVIGHFEYSGVQPNAMRKFDEVGIEYDVRALSSMQSSNGIW